MADETPHQLLRVLAAGGDSDALRKAALDLDPADVAEFLTDLPAEKRAPFYKCLPPKFQAEVMGELDPHYVEQLLEGLPEARIARLAEIMPPDDSADMLAELEDDQSERVLAKLEPEDREAIKELMDHDEESAGHIMTTEFFAAPGNIRVRDVRAELVGKEFVDPLLYVFVLEPETEVLRGVIKLIRLFTAPPDTLLEALIERDVIAVPPDEDQESVARKFQKYDLWVMPVVDASGHMLGRITVDDIMDVIEDEADEDLAIRLGAPDIDEDDESPVRIAGKRLPWLLITMFAGLLNSIVIKSMMEVTNIVAIAVFVPAILAMGGNTGMQASTVSVRGLALGEERYLRVWKTALREVMVGLSLGTVCGILTGVTVCAILHLTGAETGHLPIPALGFIVGLSMANAMIFASSFGCVAPIALSRLGADPAIAAGPFITTFNDLSASLIYFLTCVALLAIFHGPAA